MGGCTPYANPRREKGNLGDAFAQKESAGLESVGPFVAVSCRLFSALFSAP
jgi:hypothetical protein